MDTLRRPGAAQTSFIGIVLTLISIFIVFVIHEAFQLTSSVINEPNKKYYNEPNKKYYDCVHSQIASARPNGKEVDLSTCKFEKVK